MLETLPQFVDDEGKNMLSLQIELKHMEKKTKLYTMDPAFYHETYKTGFTLTYKEEYRKTQDFKDLVTEAETAAQARKNVFKKVIFKKEKMQENGVIGTLQEKLLKMICLFCEIYTCLIRDEDLDFVPSFNDKIAG